ncbi:hypothetical protein LCGC14_1554760 [marine sediment metagenome]|uniref:Putative exodeoxyribonuclease 8 PDDEXK-like domain-containing protein n=1 Tax=marine sediment metagenome TaxID=412755 RepID=A0A0F9IPA0_9ZZZZ
MTSIISRGAISPGVYTELSNEAYHADKALGSSGVKTYLDCPALFHAHYIDPHPEFTEQSKVAEMGTAAHLALLEPEKFHNEYLVLDDESVKKKTLKAWNEFKKVAKEEGKIPLLWEEYRQFCMMAEKIKQSPKAHALLLGSLKECSFFIKDEETGLILKSRPDIITTLSSYGTVMADYKTTGKSLDYFSQNRLAFDLDRDIQTSHHKNVTEKATKGIIDHVFHIIQSTKYPFLVRVIGMPPHELDIGLERAREGIRGIHNAMTTNQWPGYGDAIEWFDRPNWKINQLQEN